MPITKAGREQFLSYARLINCRVHTSLLQKLTAIRTLNSLIRLISQEELVPVGSCMDGSKVTVPNDRGDIDVLLVSYSLSLDESLFEYSERYPAYLHVLATGSHETLFNGTDFVYGKYIPVAALKQLKDEFFLFAKYVMACSTAQGIGANCVNIQRHSAVGMEHVSLKKDPITTLGFPDPYRRKEGRDFFISLIGKYSSRVLDELSKHSDKENVSPMLCSIIKIFTGPDKADVEKFTQKLVDLIKVLNSTNNPTDSNSQYRKAKREIRRDSVPFLKGNDCSLNADESKMTFQNDLERDNDEVNDLSLTGDQNTAEFSRLMSVDFVPAFSFKGWPRAANEWLHRKRKWPSEEVIQTVVKTGCQIIAKQPLFPAMYGDPRNVDNSPEHDKNDPYFRISFSQSELVLCKTFSEPQLLCWRVLKAYQKAYLATQPRVLASYHWKIVLFWILEETDSDFWTEEHVLDGVCKCLDFMIVCLENRFLPFYFIRQSNLIDGCLLDITDTVYKEVIKIRQDPIFYLKDFLDYPPDPETYLLARDQVEHIVRQTSEEYDESLFADQTFNLTRNINSHINRVPPLIGDTFSLRLTQSFKEITDHIFLERGVEKKASTPEGKKLVRNMSEAASNLLSSQETKDKSEEAHLVHRSIENTVECFESVTTEIVSHVLGINDEEIKEDLKSVCSLTTHAFTNNSDENTHSKTPLNLLSTAASLTKQVIEKTIKGTPKPDDDNDVDDDGDMSELLLTGATGILDVLQNQLKDKESESSDNRSIFEQLTDVLTTVENKAKNSKTN